VTTAPTWSAAKHLLETYDGGASELCVTDVPWSRIETVLSIVASLPDVVVEACSGEALDGSRELNEATFALLAVPTTGESQHALVSARGTAEHLQIYIWTAAGCAPFDIEFVFWNDLTFPSGLSADELSARFDRLVGLADACRGEAARSRCILSSEHNGDPRELIGSPHVVVWQVKKAAWLTVRRSFASAHSRIDAFRDHVLVRDRDRGLRGSRAGVGPGP
jgi:hypothetical protein